jgi:hypothetical protein
MFKRTKAKNHSKGQAMLFTVLSLGGAMLGVTTIAGILMVYQIRDTTDFENSAKAVFAADAGTELALYDFFQPVSFTPSPFSNGASMSTTCYDVNNAVTDCGATLVASSSATYAVARGSSLGSERAFYVNFSSATGTMP